MKSGGGEKNGRNVFCETIDILKYFIACRVTKRKFKTLLNRNLIFFGLGLFSSLVDDPFRFLRSRQQEGNGFSWGPR